MMPATIHVRFRMDGLHYWPAAPVHRAYLAMEHRHLFHVEVSTQVEHDDREIEFHDLMSEAQVAFMENCVSGTNLGTASCEMIARHMAAALAAAHRRTFTVSVFEDGECGATVMSEPA